MLVFWEIRCESLGKMFGSASIARLKPGVTVEQARAEVSASARRLAALYPDTNRGVGATVVPVWAGHLGAQGLLLRPLQILMAVCVLLLFVVCANVANLLLARAVWVWISYWTWPVRRREQPGATDEV